MSVNAAAGLLLASVLFTSIALEPFGSEQSSGTERPTAQLQPRRAAGAASVAGTVVNDEGGPLSRARVTLRSALLPEPRVLVTDGMGRFSFDRLPAGDYELSFIRTGYALSHASGGPARAVAVRLREGETRTGLSIALRRAGIIPGRLLDEDGTPLAGAEIEALSLRTADGRQSTSVVAAARSDDRGEFRLTGLPAGQYVVLARDPAFNVGRRRDRRFALRANLLSGRRLGHGCSAGHGHGRARVLAAGVPTAPRAPGATRRYDAAEGSPALC